MHGVILAGSKAFDTREMRGRRDDGQKFDGEKDTTGAFSFRL